MGKIFCMMGKSASGKDSIYEELYRRTNISVKKIIPYTTRPIRQGEENGREYFFCDEETVQSLSSQGKIVEMRSYDTVYGIWRYLTVDDGQVNLTTDSYLVIGTLEAYLKLRQYYGEDKVLPIYIEVEDGERLLRAIAREKMQDIPKYEEMCRRFLADASDFSEEKIKEAGITRRFQNLKKEQTIQEVETYILENRG